MKQGVVGESLASVYYYLTPGDKRQFILMLVLLLISSLLEVFGLASLVPIIMAASRPGTINQNKYTAWIYNLAGFENEKTFLLFAILLILLFFVAKNIFTTWVNYKQVSFSTKVALQIIEDQFKKFTSLPYWDFINVGSSIFTHHILNIPQQFVTIVIRQLFVLLSEIFIVAIIIVAILFYQPFLFLLLVLVLVPSTLLTYRLLRQRSQYVGARLDKLRPVPYAILSDMFAGFTELTLANKKHKFKERLNINQEEFQKLEGRSYLYSLIPLKVIEMVAIFAISTIFIYSLFFTENPANVITIIGAFAAAAYRLMPSVNRIISSLVALKQSEIVRKELERYRKETFPQLLSANKQPLLFTQDITFKNISFSFPSSDTPVINNISFQVKKGEKIGFIGTSGSGKTTLMNVLLRFYPEESGNILVDGIPLSGANLLAWYQLIGYVKQDTFLMEASIQDNITLHDDNPDEERLKYAIEQASLSHFVNSLPEGVNTRIGERGSRLSGGQRQRIGIARALYKKTEIMILDEATSALDNETEHEVNESINRLSHTAITLFIIAHRLTTLRYCDRIYELKEGEIIAEHQYADIIADLH
ncbi:ABC transporter ATP-binding protein [Hymenobacter weizhouensis]|uniref:ABC transporter ATP-binding protein n=1 Tax=Hymenobacter sp. YIM 151500-1 TaxID=2987689 RepID=UPI002226BD62|nr:ABC transporter ATP-binding protein/permease [Hymenobacter sp. YIM 151500-1]UYZ61363.1 ABC transporter ATP-binding protein/permease [Hymenobacter sp. YIM 151500-1]